MNHHLRVSTFHPARTPLATDRMWAAHIERIASLHPTLQLALAGLQQHAGAPDRCWLYVVCGHRGQREQDEAYKAGKSNAQFGESWHNVWPSLAVDIWPVTTRNLVNFADPAAHSLLKELASVSDSLLEWGGRWTRLRDLPHFQLLTPYATPKEALRDAGAAYEIIPTIRALPPD